jgi:propanediol utilization protein/ribosomal protein S18 acetylase RimI-like enzyme
MQDYGIDPKKVNFKKENKWLVPIVVIERHIHLSQEDINVLFGANYQLTVNRKLPRNGEFIAKETLNIIGPKGVIEKVHIYGPAREKSQIEISRTDALNIGIDSPLRDSADLEETPGVILFGPKNHLILNNGCITPRAHIHMNIKNAEKLEINNQDKVSVLIKGTKTVCYHDVLVKVSETGKNEFHIDTDEANAAFVESGDLGMIKHKEMVVKDNFGNIIQVNVDNIKFILGKRASDYFVQEGIRILLNVFEYPFSVQREINEKLLNPDKVAPNKFYFYTAVEGEKIVGIASFYYLENVKLGYLENIGITPEYQGRGIGSLFYHKVISFLEKKHPDIEGILLEVRQSKEGLDNRKSFFLNLGAVPIDTDFYPSEYLSKGKDLLLMFKPLVVNTCLNTGILERAFNNLSKVL